MSLGETTLGEAWSWVGPLFGTGAITAIVVAWLGRKSPTRSDAATGAMGVGALLADSTSITMLSHELKRLADANEIIGRGIARYCDLMDITQALERLQKERSEKRHHKEPS